MNRMWSVRTGPYLVDTVVPSTSGSRSRCTPWRDTSAPPPPSPPKPRDATLSISSMKTMPFCSALWMAAVRISSSLTSLPASSSISSFMASPILSLRVLRLAAAELAEHAAQLLGHLLHAGRAHDFQLRPRLRPVRARCPCRRAGPRAASCGRPGAPCPPAAGSAGARRRDQHVQDALLGGVLGARAHLAHLGHARLLHGHLGQVADDGVHVLADVADLGELGRLDLDERRVGQPRQPARDLGLAHAGGADHEDVLGRDLAAQLLVHLLAAPAVAQARSPPRAWRRPGRRCGDRVRRRFPGGSWTGRIGWAAA